MQQPEGADPPCAAPEYGEALIDLLAVIWGEGFLSPGGPQEVAALLEGVDVAGKRVLDVGCGAGGIELLLVRDHGAGTVVGVDVEAPVLARARALLERHGFAGRVRFEQVAPGPLPFADASFDLVFSKDAVIHIEDKEGWCRDMYRLLRPGGLLVASDWMRIDESPPSAAMRAYMAAEGLSFRMSALPRYGAALRAAGFTDIVLRDRNEWYRERVRREYEAIRGPLYDRLCAAAGKAETDRNLDVWEKLCVVVESGEHRPGHFRGRKP
jgi:phosphoethanolamine N-methyltransferase